MEDATAQLISKSNQLFHSALPNGRNDNWWIAASDGPARRAQLISFINSSSWSELIEKKLKLSEGWSASAVWMNGFALVVLDFGGLWPPAAAGAPPKEENNNTKQRNEMNGRERAKWSQPIFSFLSINQSINQMSLIELNWWMKKRKRLIEQAGHQAVSSAR